MSTTLTAGELEKRPWRQDLFLNKYKNKDPKNKFELKDKKTKVKLVPKDVKGLENAFKFRKSTFLNNFIFEDVDGNE